MWDRLPVIAFFACIVGVIWAMAWMSKSSRPQVKTKFTVGDASIELEAENLSDFNAALDAVRQVVKPDGPN